MLTCILGLLFVGPVTTTTTADAGLFVRSLWLLQQHGTPAATDTSHDGPLKAALAKAVARDSVITFDELGGYMTHESFRKLAGQDSSIDTHELTSALNAASPPSREKLHAQARNHAEYLTTTFDMIDEAHRHSAQSLARWMISQYAADKSLDVIVVCTGNSRRSILGSTMGNLAAAYYGLSNIRFHSGGTAPSAFNPRTVRALSDIGIDITATGQEAPPGDDQTLNPIYRVVWGDGLETLEFSKHYADPINPKSGFAAVMVCTEADAGCPTVPGAMLRLSMPYADPKAYDDSRFESLKYAERRDDIGRTLLSVMCQVRHAIDADQSK